MQKYGNLKNGQKHFFWALSLLFMSGQKMQTIKTRIWKPRSITWFKRLYYSVLNLAFLLLTLKKWDANNVTALLEYTKEGIELVYANGCKRHCYLILARLIVDYEEQVLIIRIKANMQCLIYYVPPKERELVIRLWEPRTQWLTWNQLERQRNDPAIQRNRAADGWLH